MSEPSTPVIVNYDVAEQDVGAFTRWALRTDVRAWLQYLFLAAILLPGAVLIGALFGSPLFIGIFLAILAITTPIELRKKMRTLWRESGLVGWHSLELDPTGLLYRSVNGAIRLDWRQIQGIVRERERAFFLIGPLNGIVLPYRSFQDPAGAEQFVRHAEVLREEALALPIAPSPPLVVPDGSYGVEYALHEDDIRATQLYPFRKSSRAFVFFGILAIAAVAASAYRWGPAWAAVLVLLEGAMLTAIGLGVLRERQQALADPSTTAARSVVISPQGLASWGAGAEQAQITWAQVKSVDSGRDHIFLQWKQENALAIPRRCFATEADAEEFLARSREWLQAAQPPAPGRKR